MQQVTLHFYSEMSIPQVDLRSFSETDLQGLDLKHWVISLLGLVFRGDKRLKFGLSPELRLTNHCSAHHCSVHNVIADISIVLCYLPSGWQVMF